MFGIKKKDEPVRDAIKRRMTHEAMILDMFKRGDEVSTTTLSRFSRNHTARISGLRKEGHVIIRNYEGNGIYSYTYLGQKDED